MTADNANWKKHLLSSGAPLEYEVARVLARGGFAVDSEFEFIRRDGSSAKEFSVDLSATWYSERGMTLGFSLEALVECKYRSRDKYLLFFRDTNRPDFSPAMGGTLSVIDQFCPFHIHDTPLYELDDGYPLVYKGVEVFDKGAQEKDVRHAVNQLRYAAPILLRQTIMSCLEEHVDDRFPRFLTRILVSNAPLRVLRAGGAIDLIEGAGQIEDISTQHDVVILHSGVGPDLLSHYKSTFSELNDSKTRNEVRRMEYSLEAAGKRFPSKMDRPGDFFDDIVEFRWPSHRFVSQVFVVTLAGLPEFLKVLKQTSRRAYRGRKKSGNWTPRRRRA